MKYIRSFALRSGDCITTRVKGCRHPGYSTSIYTQVGKVLIVVAVLLQLAILAACQPLDPTLAPNPGSDVQIDLISYTNDEVGISLTYPAEWFIEFKPHFGLLLGTTEEAIHASGPIVGKAVIFIRIDDASAIGGNTLTAKLTTVITSIAGKYEIDAEAAPTTISGQAALRTEFSGTRSGVEYMGVGVAISSGERVAVAFSAFPSANADEFYAVTEAVLETIQLPEPATEIIDLV